MHGSDDRKSFRATVIDGCEGTLHLGQMQVLVRVLDQSATGFKLATEDERPIPEMVEALLNLDDGVQHNVQIRHVQREGDLQTLGVKRLATRLRRPGDSGHAEAWRRLTIAKVAVLLLFVVVSALALQAAPVRKQLAGFSLFQSLVRQEPAGKSHAGTSQASFVPTFDRDRPFQFQRYLDDDAADWLQLATSQRRLMRGLLDLCGGREGRLPPAQRAFLDFAAEASMLELLDAEQRGRLEKELHQPFSGSALLQNIIQRHSSKMSPAELSKVFGSLLIVSPEIATRCGVPQETVAAVCREIDAALQPMHKNKQEAQAGIDAEQIVLGFSLRLQELEANCRNLVDSKASKPTEPEPEAAAEVR